MSERDSLTPEQIRKNVLQEIARLEVDAINGLITDADFERRASLIIAEHGEVIRQALSAPVETPALSSEQMALSLRLRPGVECAPWVVQAVLKLEQQCAETYKMAQMWENLCDTEKARNKRLLSETREYRTEFELSRDAVAAVVRSLHGAERIGAVLALNAVVDAMTGSRASVPPQVETKARQSEKEAEDAYFAERHPSYDRLDFRALFRAGFERASVPPGGSR